MNILGVSLLILTQLFQPSFTQNCEQSCTDVCPDGCNSLTEQGQCDLSLGRCVCIGNWGGDNCGVQNGPDPQPADGGNQLDISTLPDKIDAFEDAVKTLAARVEELFSQADGKKKKGWYNYCDSDHPPGSECDPEYGRTESCNCDGRRVAQDIYGMRTPDNVDCRIEEANMVAGALEPLIDTYIDLSSSVPSISIQYFGSDDGIFHHHPAFRSTPGTECPSYDPRRRPWYIAASSGPKRVVLIIDRSGSMAENRMEKAKEAAISIIGGLSFDDYFGIVLFDDLISTYRPQLQVASSSNRESAIDWLGDVSSRGATDFYLGFEEGFNLLDTCSGTCEDPCRSAILFLTDGENGGSDVEDFVKDWMDDNNDADLFTFTLGDGADKDVPRDLAEQNHGVYQHISDGGDLLSTMGSYYQYYAVGIAEGASDVVRWTEPYEDFSGLGPMMTAGIPVYDRSKDPPIFLGVVAIDMQACDIYEAYAAQDIFEVLKERGSTCIEWDMKDSYVDEMVKRQKEACGVSGVESNSGSFFYSKHFLILAMIMRLIF